jgi:hypothetical protein
MPTAATKTRLRRARRGTRVIALLPKPIASAWFPLCGRSGAEIVFDTPKPDF